MNTIKIKEEKIKSILPGTSGVIVDSDLNRALRIFKKNMKDNDKLKTYYNKRYHKSKSIKRKEILENAIYYQKIKSNTESNG